MKGSSRLPKYNWHVVLKEVPKKRHAQVRAEVEAALREFLATDGISSPERKRWRRVARLAKFQGVEELRQKVSGPLDPLLPDPGFFDALAPAANWPQQLGYLLTWLPDLAAAIADLYKPKERLYARLCRAWGAPGQSATGPFVRFVQQILDPILPDVISDDTVRDFVERDQKRRRIGAAAALSGEGGLIVNERVSTASVEINRVGGKNR
jgi:hypothetical protein